VKTTGKRLIYLSTDQLFEGRQEWYAVGDEGSPIKLYGKTKQAGEEAVLKMLPDALVIRSNFFGWGPPHKPALTDWALAQLRRDSPVSGFTDVFFSPILLNDLLDRIET